MALKSIQSCHMDPINRAEGKFTVTANSDDASQQAIFRCSSEDAARKLRDAIREHADELRRVYDYSR